MQIIHGASTGSSKDVHAVRMYDANVRVSGDRWSPFGEQGRPSAHIKVKNMRIGKVAGTIVTSIQNQHVLMHNSCCTISRTRPSSSSWNSAPLGECKVKLVQIRPERKHEKSWSEYSRLYYRSTLKKRYLLVGSIVSPKDVEGMSMYHGRMGMAR